MGVSKVEEYLSNLEIMQVQKDLDALIDEKTNNKLTIAFCGIFSSGKSSLINAVLNQEFKLPTGGEPVTKFVTRIEYGKEFGAYYIAQNHIVYIDTDKVKEIVQGKRSLPDRCNEIVLQMPADILKPDIVFIDTPGFEDEKTLEELTRKAVRGADVAIFCCNADHFGREFEQAYFQELEDSIGNFCVVVNHTDVIHTEEEFDRLEEYVCKMVMGRGKRQLKNVVSKTTFYTVGAGRYTDLDGLDIFLQELSNAKGDSWSVLKAYADKKRLLYGLNIISPIVKDNVQNGANLHKELEEELTADYDELMEQYQVECRMVEKDVQSLRSFIYDSLNKKTGIVHEKLEGLEREGKHLEFVQSASKALHDCYMSLPGDIKMWKQKKPLLKGKDLDVFSGDLMATLKQYNVPAPKGQKVKNRGLLGKIAISTVMTVLLLDPYLDDGYDIEYHGYAKDAINSIKNNLVPKINRIIDSYLQNQREASMPPMPEWNTEILEKVSSRMEKWQEIDQEINYFISELAEINV